SVARARPPPAPVPPGRPPTGRAGSWLLVPHLSASQELVYGGTFAEEGVGSVQFSRRYHLASRVFVLGADAKGQDVAVLTVLKDGPAAGAASAAPRPGAGPPALSARLERVRVDVQGNVSPAKGVSLTVSLEGPPTIECGAFVPLPPGRVHADRPWVVREWGRPDWRWRADGTEAVNG